MDDVVYTSIAGLPPRWLEPIRIAAHELGLDFDPVAIRGWLTGSDLIATVRSLGGTIKPVAPFHGWILARDNTWNVEPISRFAPELVAANVHVADFNGVVAIELDGEVYLALRITEQVFPGQMERALILAGRSLEVTLTLASRLKAGLKTLYGKRPSVYGTELPISGTPAVTEEDLVLPGGLQVRPPQLCGRFLAVGIALRPDADRTDQRVVARRRAGDGQDARGAPSAHALPALPSVRVHGRERGGRPQAGLRV